MEIEIIELDGGVWFTLSGAGKIFFGFRNLSINRSPIQGIELKVMFHGQFF